MAEKIRYYDDHYLYCETGSLTENRVEQSLQCCVDALKKQCILRVNVVETKSGLKGCAYIFVSDIGVAYALRGLNMDGTERCLIEKDKTWTPPSEEKDMVLEKAFTEMVEEGLEWGEFSDLEEEIENKYHQPERRLPLPSLISLPEVPLSEEEQEILPKVEEYSGPVISQWKYKIEKAYCYGVESGKVKNVLLSRNAPRWISAAMVRRIFHPYALHCGKKYPHIQLVKTPRGNNIFVTYHPNSRDASFALLMTRKVRFVVEGKSTMVFFDYALKSFQKHI